MLKGGPICAIKNFSKKVHSAEKIQVENTKISKGGSLVCFRGSYLNVLLAQVHY